MFLKITGCKGRGEGVQGERLERGKWVIFAHLRA